MSDRDALWLLLSVLKFSGGCPAEGELREAKGDVPWQPDLKIETWKKAVLTESFGLFLTAGRSFVQNAAALV